MAVKASVTITISKYRDTDSITRYYKLQASTAAAPAVPTTLTPSGWSTSEPTYTSGSTNTLYYTDCIVFSDGTFQYTDDGNGKAVKSSSYEAAKEAYNKAQNAQDTINNLEIGGRNLIIYGKGDVQKGFFKNVSYNQNNELEIDWVLEPSSTTKYKSITNNEGYVIPIGEYEPGAQYTWSYDIILLQKEGIDEWQEFCMGQRYTTGGTVNYQHVTRINHPNLNNMVLNTWQHVEKIITIPNTNYPQPTANQQNLICSLGYKSANGGRLRLKIKNVKLEKGNKASAWCQSLEEIEMNANDSSNNNYEKVQSKAEQLIINGTASMRNNTNFSQFEYDGTQAFNSGGSFKRKSKYPQPAHTDELFSVNPDNTYIVSEYLKTETGAGNVRMFDFLLFYDIDKLEIKAEYHMYINGSTTELISDLKNGDTIVYLNDVSGFDQTKTQSYQRGFIIWDYKNSMGYQYPPETYSRKYYSDLFEMSGIDLTNNTITLKQAWNKGTIPSGTKLSQCNSGNTYKYLNSNFSPPSTWTKYSGLIGGIDYSGTNASKKFPPGTAYASMGWLWNYNNVDEYAWVTNISVTENASLNSTIKSITNLYYASNSSTPPSKPSSHIPTTNPSVRNGWNISLPTYDDSYPYLYTCKEILKNDNTYSWTSVEQTTYSDAIKNLKDDLSDIQADYVTNTNFTRYKNDKQEDDTGIKQRLLRTEVTIYGDPNDPHDSSALVNKMQELDTNLNGENGAIDRLENTEGILNNSGLDEYNSNIKINQRFLDIEDTVDQIKRVFNITGGVNLVQNSVGYFEDNLGNPTMWNIENNTIVKHGYDADLIGVTLSRGKLGCAKGSLTSSSDNISGLIPNKVLSISFKYKNGANATSKIKVFSGNITYFEKTFSSTVNTWTEYISEINDNTFICNSSSLQIKIESSNSTNNNGFEISDLMLNYGDPKSWELCSNEVYGAMFKLSSLGIELTAKVAKTKNFMTTDGILVYEYDPATDSIVGNEPITKITDNGTLTNMLESTGDIIERDLIHTMINLQTSAGTKQIYVEYIR